MIWCRVLLMRRVEAWVARARGLEGGAEGWLQAVWIAWRRSGRACLAARFGSLLPFSVCLLDLSVFPALCVSAAFAIVPPFSHFLSVSPLSSLPLLSPLPPLLSSLSHP